MRWIITIKEIGKEPKRIGLQCSWPLEKIRSHYGLDKRKVEWYSIEKVR